MRGRGEAAQDICGGKRECLWEWTKDYEPEVRSLKLQQIFYASKQIF